MSIKQSLSGSFVLLFKSIDWHTCSSLLSSFTTYTLQCDRNGKEILGVVWSRCHLLKLSPLILLGEIDLPLPANLRHQ